MLTSLQFLDQDLIKGLHFFASAFMLILSLKLCISALLTGPAEGAEAVDMLAHAAVVARIVVQAMYIKGTGTASEPTSSTASHRVCHASSSVRLMGLGSENTLVSTLTPRPFTILWARRLADLLFSPGSMRVFALACARWGSTLVAVDAFAIVNAAVVRSWAFSSPPRIPQSRLIKGFSGSRLAYTIRQGSLAWRPMVSISFFTTGV